ncbi:hypothetical protein [Vibrio cholerae]|uniref:hypothetical protein n=1 Tax=Vibrio cholerae TaxID=666 RepID=UPI0006E6644B|nr:hypothetical protein [Vibrio cholerae]KQA39386.1 hypothetical protein XV74_07585 [Vibrio cholerae]KQA46557.1 hypothetical protein XV75_09160 [Vibrio cholerae]KQA60286.1 hypothetical protein XV79_01320 [Vibrio cholerae]KQA77259.1 hypothetical protein XV84_02210 [Vibrio cholerae]KQA78846.1 hypothetical protein XV85_06435 [Vibrio cholerae]
MRQSIYLQLAVLLVRAELRREERVWKRKVRRSSYHLPWNHPHLLRDIGLETDGRPIGLSLPDAVVAERRVRHIRRVLAARIPT